MKAISLTQPWATLVAIGAKHVETRSWNTAERGVIAIHAAKGFPAECKALHKDDRFFAPLDAAGYWNVGQLPTGAIIAVAYLVRTFRFDETNVPKPPERWFGDYTAGRYGFVFESTIALKTPIACRGALGFWTVPTDVRGRIIEQL